MGTTTESDYPKEVLNELKKRKDTRQRVENVTKAARDAVEAFKAPKLALVLSVAFAAHVAQIGLGELLGAFLIVHGSSLLPIRVDVRSKS